MPISSSTSALLAINHATFEAAPLANALEQEYLLESALHQCRLKEDHFMVAPTDEERLVWMARMAEPLGDSRLGGECYRRLQERTADLLLSFADNVDSDKIGFYIKKLAVFTPIVPRLYVQISLLKRLDNYADCIHANVILRQLDGILNPMKGLHLRQWIMATAHKLFDNPESALQNAKQSVSLWARWTRYGGCEEVEVRDWEREQLFPTVENAVRHFLSHCRPDSDMFTEWCIERFMNAFLVQQINDDQAQSRVFKVVAESVPKAVISKHLERLLLMVMRFSPAVNITELLQDLIGDAFQEGSVSMPSVWAKLKEIIEMRPELDLNDSLRLINTTVSFALKEGDFSVIRECIDFVNGNLLDGIDSLNANEPSAYSLVVIIDLLVSTLRAPTELDSIIDGLVVSVSKLTSQSTKGLGLKLLRSTRGCEISDWTSILLFASECKEPVDDVVQELLGYHDVNSFLPFTTIYKEILDKTLQQLFSESGYQTKFDPQSVKQILEPPQPEFFSTYIQLMPLVPSNQERYELMANAIMATEGDLKFEKMAVMIDAIVRFRDKLDDTPVLLSRLAMLSKRLLVKQERVEALFALSVLPDSDHRVIVESLLQLSSTCSSLQKKQLFKLAIKHDLGLERREELVGLLDPQDPEYRFLCTQLPCVSQEESQSTSDAHEQHNRTAFDTMPVENPFKDW